MGDNVKMFELTDEQLKTVTGGSLFRPISSSASTNTNTTVNVSHITQSNAILFRKVSSSTIGVISVTQSHVSSQVND